MATTKNETRSAKRAPSKAKAKAKASKASLKRASKANGKVSKAKASKANGKARKASKANGKVNGAVRKGGGKALSDFGNAAKLRVLKPKEIPARGLCFKTGQTVSANLAAQKAYGFCGRRKFIRAQISQGRISLS